jgi:cytoskeletal protein CcmA (bactofilin family)
MFGRGSKLRKPRIETLVGATTLVHGDLEFSGGLHIDGRVAGNVMAPLDSDSTLSVSEHGCIEGGVQAPNVVLDGVVKGDIRARDRVVLGAHARVRGNVTYGIIEITLGAEIQGRLVQNAPETPAVAVRASAT